MDRKKFLKVISTGAVCSGLLPLVQSCATYRYVDAQLESNQLMVPKSIFGDDDFVLIRNPQGKAPIYLKRSTDGKKPRALLMECTHKQCTVNPAGNRFSCPCHGSQFDATGKVLEGPARKELHSYPVSTTEKEILINLSNN